MKISIITLGCQLNRSESQRMAYLLKRSGYEIVDNPEGADIVIINTCTVKTPAENKAFKLLRKYKDKIIILTGCLVQHQPELFKDYTLVGVYQIDKIVEAVERTLKGERPKYLEIKRINKLKIPSLDQYPIKIIPIQEGCLWQCSYCATKLARKLMQSFPPEDVYREIRDAKLKNLRVIWLTGTDLAVYGFDMGLDLADLLFGIKDIEGLFFIRVGMMNPGIINKFIDKLLRAFEEKRIFKFFHIPVQSGSNKVLKDMRRGYTIEEFYDLVYKIREKYPEASIATDIIVGYPTETEEDFKLTIQMMEEIKFDVVNISRFWPRPKTEAAKLKPLPGHIVKERSRTVTKVFNETAKERNKQWLGWKGWVVIESKGTKENSWIGRNYAYKQVIVKSSENLLGKFVKVEIKDYTAVDLRGKILDVKEQIDIDDWYPF